MEGMDSNSEPLIAFLHRDAVPHRISYLFKLGRSGFVKIERRDV